MPMRPLLMTNANEVEVANEASVAEEAEAKEAIVAN
jgi:hypothetical protein